MKRLFIAILAILAALALWRGVGHTSGQTGWGANAGVLPKYVFAQLPPERDGYSLLVVDGTPGAPCTGGGTGAAAVGIGGQWVCLGSGSINSVLLSVPLGFTASTSMVGTTSTQTLLFSGQTCTSGTTPCAVTAGVLSGNAAGSNVTFNLPTATGSNAHVDACKTDATANTVTLHRASGTINGLAADSTLSNQWQCLQLTDAAAGNWIITGSGNVGTFGGSINISGTPFVLTGTSTTGADKIVNFNVNGIDNVRDWGAKGDGTTDDWAALMSTVADACANNKAVLFPPGTYKVLTPFAPACATSPLRIYSEAGTVAEATGTTAVIIKEGFSNDAGPTEILDHYQEISSLNSGNILTSPAVGAVGKALSFTNAGSQLIYAVDLNDVLPHPARNLNGLAAFDFRGWFNLATLTTVGGSFGNFLIGSVGGVDAIGGNTYEACNINTGSGYEGDGLSNNCEGLFALQTGTDGKLFARFYTSGGIYRINSGATVFNTNAWHFVELSYDGSNLRLILDGTLRGTIAATGTTIQRADESLLIGQELPIFLHDASGSVPLLNGQIYSPEVSSVARSTCGGSTTPGASCYSNPSTANPGDANSLFLWNGDLTELPLNGGIAVPVLEPDRVQGVALNTSTTTAWLHVRTIGGGNPIGCCSQLVQQEGFNLKGGTHGLDVSGEQVQLRNILTSPPNFSGGGDIGIETSANATYNSTLQHIFACNGGAPSCYVPLALNGGITQGDDLNMGCNGMCLEEMGGVFTNVFTQLASGAKWSFIHLGATTKIDTGVFDNENGASNTAVVLQGGDLELVNSSLQAGGTGSVFRSEGGGNPTMTMQDGIIMAGGSATSIIDAVTTNAANPQRYSFKGVSSFLGDFLGNILNGVNWISNDMGGSSLQGDVEIDTVSEAATGNKNIQQYHLLQGLHVTGPVVGGLNESGAIKAAALTVPAGPIVTPKGTTGATSYSYFCVAHDATSTSNSTGSTPASSVTTITNGNASLSATNFNQIQCGPQAGVYSWDILKTNTSTSLALAVLGYQVIVNDTGQATAGYTAPTRNSTGDINAVGNLSAGTPLTAPTTGDISGARSATTGELFLGSNGSNSLDFGITSSGNWTLLGGTYLRLPQALNAIEQAAPAGVANGDVLWGDSTAHRLKVIPNNGNTYTVGEVVASGTSALNVGALTAGTCESVVTTAATNALTTDAIEWAHNAAVTAATNGLLTIHAWPTANNVNFLECNPTANSVTPPADTLNWVVIR